VAAVMVFAVAKEVNVPDCDPTSHENVLPAPPLPPNNKTLS
jgi:hypothetical protein